MFQYDDCSWLCSESGSHLIAGEKQGSATSCNVIEPADYWGDQYLLRQLRCSSEVREDVQ